MENAGKILIIKPSSLGDVVHGLPFLYCVKKRFPKAGVHWVIARGLEELLAGHPMIERLWVINKDRWKEISSAGSTVREIRSLFRELKKEKFDVAVDLQGLLRSGLIAAATKAEIRVGFREAREGSRLFYTRLVEGGKNAHAVDRYLKIAADLGCDTSKVRFPIQAPDGISPSVPGDYAVLVPGARWRTKRWPAERFGELASLLSVKSVVVGGKADVSLEERIVSIAGGKAVALAGRTNLRELTAVLKKARFVVSNDSGPMHIAAALGVPVFALFGPTSPQRTGPYGGGHTVIKGNAQCSPCFKRSCGDLRCMESISARDVVDAIKKRGIFRT